MKIQGDFWPAVLFLGWLCLVGWILKETEGSEWWLVLAFFGPIIFAVAFQSWKEDKNRKD
ncbi:MAG: hypothetical protein MUF81_10705 [Verrucomicrobia bacterium]|jgi:hypothetical protein|nr:hypothetical protein [Verrucomicrobiota bacterium]